MEKDANYFNIAINDTADLVVRLISSNQLNKIRRWDVIGNFREIKRRCIDTGLWNPTIEHHIECLEESAKESL